MAKQLILNLMIAMVWMLLHDEWNTLMFAVGYVLGIVLIYSLRRFFPEPFYGNKLWAIVKLLLLFNVELFKSSITVMKQVLRPTINIKPGIILMKTGLKSDWEITILANLLTLTPGSVVVEVSPSEGIMYLHAMDVAELQHELVATKNRFEKAIQEVWG